MEGVSLGIRKARLQGTISITPLIDVVFILLIFFILETSFLRQGAIGVAGDSKAAASDSEVKPLRIEVYPGGRVWVQTSSLTLVELRGHLRELDLPKETPVIVASAAGVTVQELVSTTDACFSNGLTRIRPEKIAEGIR